MTLTSDPFTLDDDYQYFLEDSLIPEPEPFELCLPDGTPLCDDDSPPDPDGFVLSNN